jgi:O-antigen/teichoic acid export membrane protein
MADKFIITGYVGSAQLAYYGLAQRLMGQVHGGLYGLTQTLFPTFAAMGENLATAIRRRGDAIAWMLGLLVLSAYGAELAAGPLIFKRVVGASFFQKVWPFFILATVYGIALGFGLLAWYLSLGANQPRINSLMSVGYGLVAFPLLFLAVSRLGALGAALVQLLMVLNTVAHLLWIRRIVTGAGESGWRALRSAFAPFMPWAVTGAAWLGIASYLVLVAHVGIVGYTLLVLVGGAATMLAIVWYERGRQSGRYALLAATTQMMVRGFEAAFRWGRERVASV